MLTERMKQMDAFLRETMHSAFPVDYVDFILDGTSTEDEIIIQIMAECCKYAHDMVSEKKSLRAYSQDQTDDKKRMQIQRSNEKINKYRKAEFEHLQQQGITIEGLLSPNMKDIESKTSGYQYNDLQYWEINNVRKMNLVRHIFERSITRKNYSSFDLEADSSQYDQVLGNLRTSRDELFSSLALFTLEWKYSFEFFYAIAAEMEKKKTEIIPNITEKISLLCSRPQIISILSTITPNPVTVYTDSRMLIQRFKMIPFLFSEVSADIPGSNFHRFQENIVISALIRSNTQYDHVPLLTWFCHNTTEEDWLSVFHCYDVFQIYNREKVWTRSIVRNIKYLYSESTFDYHFPQNRS